MERSRKTNVWAAMVAVVMLAGLFLSAESPAASLTSIVSIVGGNAAKAVAISADGSTVAGTLDEGGPTSYAFIWTADEGTQLIGSFGQYHSDAYDISADGTTIVGSSLNDSDLIYYPFKWTSGGGMVSLGTLGGTEILNQNPALGVSADGSVIVGHTRDANNVSHAFRWTSSGMEDLGTLAGEEWAWSMASDISDDSTVIAGQSDTADGYTRAFRWTAESGMVDIGTLGGNYSSVSCMSGDGTTIVGLASTSDEQNCPFRWTEETGMVNITSGPFDGQMLGISADGSIIVGQDFNGTAFIWTQATGILDLRSVLQAQGVDVDGWVLGGATDVTILPDGSCSIVGVGGLDGYYSYVANLAIPVPEPATISLFVLAVTGMLARRRK